MKLNIDQAANIGGWMSYKELKWLAKQAKKHLRIVEIGTFWGRSTRALGDNTPGVVYTFDDFRGPRDIFLTPAEAPAFLQASHNLVDLIQAGKVVLNACDHSLAKTSFTPDMVFLDGDHTYTGIHRDIELWLPQLRKGDIICGHDYTNMEGVRMAVKELVPKAKTARGTSIWYYVI